MTWVKQSKALEKSEYTENGITLVSSKYETNCVWATLQNILDTEGNKDIGL